MAIPNQLILFNNHFAMHRRHYPFRTRLAIAADIGYDGYEFHPMEPDDDKSWDEATAAFKASGLKSTGMYIVSKGINDDDYDKFDAELTRAKRMIDRLVAMSPKAFVNYTIASNPRKNGTPDYSEAGSAKAEARHWERTVRMLREIDAHVTQLGLSANLYNHIWFMIDTSAAQLRALK